MAEQPSARAVELLNADLSAVLARAERVLQHYGVGHWRLTLIARNPEPGKDDEWTCLTSDDEHAVARAITEGARSVLG